MAVQNRQVKLAKDEKQLDGAGGGFKRNYVFVVENAEYGVKDDGDRLFLRWYGYDRDSNEEEQESFTMGTGWSVPDPDEPWWCEHQDGFDSFSKSTVVGQMVNNAKNKWGMREAWIKRLGGLPDPRDAGMWVGGIFQMGAQTYDKFGSPKGAKDGERTVPIKFLGWVDEKPAKAEAKTETKAEKPKPAKATKAGANGAASVLDQLTALAAEAASFQEWQTKAILVPGLGTDPQLMPKITDEAFYESLKA